MSESALVNNLAQCPLNLRSRFVDRWQAFRLKAGLLVLQKHARTASLAITVENMVKIADMKTSLLRWELIGIIVISVLGSILHFSFDWSGGWKPLGVISAVNESVWEHLKIGFWPALFYGVFEYPFLKKLTDNFTIAKASGIYAIPFVIVVLFYSYTGATGREILIVDILIFVIAIAVGQVVSYKILTMHKLTAWQNRLGLTLLIVLAVAFGVFTFFPPELSIFRDSVTGTYGIR